MINYLSFEEIEIINKLVLEITDEKFQLEREDDILSIIEFVRNNFDDDLFKKALAYCIALIVLHPFKEGNHRTSLISAEEFLIKNGFFTGVSDIERLKLQKWRLEYGKKNDLEREFFRIACIEDIEKRNEKIIEMMNSKYGQMIENWLKRNYRVKINEPSHRI